MPPYLSKPQTAKRYGVVTRTIDRRVELGSLRKPDVRISGYPYWDEAKLDEDDRPAAGGADAATDVVADAAADPVADLLVPDTGQLDPETLAKRLEQRREALKTARARAALVRTRASQATASDLAD
jgi:hypothetical protein